MIKLCIGYVLLLCAQVPVAVFSISTFFANPLGLSGVSLVAPYGLLALIYSLAVLGLGCKLIADSFLIYKAHNVQDCLRCLMVLKYGMVPYFIVNFLWLSLWAFILLIATRGTVLVVAPILLFTAMFFTWLVLLPGGFYGLQVVRLTKKEGNLSRLGCLVHGILQFCFFLDVLDCAYLVAWKWKRGKLAAILVCLFYCVGVVLAFFAFARFSASLS
jgi:hypothetical protein